ncbi:MAG: hypothetical protein PHS45_02275 [Bacilli bacterium]|nr:hypothetical protein [Bacilli bacterium]
MRKKRNIYKFIINYIPYVVLLVFISLLLSRNSQYKINIELNDNFDITTSIEGELINNCYKNLYNVQDEKKVYENKNGRLEIIKRTFDNDDIMIFYSLDSKTPTTAVIKLNKKIFKIKSLEEYEIEKEYSNITGYDSTSIPAYYIEFESGGSALISKNYLYNVLYKKYNNNQISRLRSLIREEDSRVNQKTGSIETAAIKGHADGWILLSNEKLFISDEDIQQYADMLNNKPVVSAWLTSEGQYTKIPYSIEPYTKEGYSRNPGANHGKEELYMYEQVGKRIYYDLMWNKVMGLYNMPRDESGVWYTEYTSTYISIPFGVVAPFVDTRHNENITQFLNMIGNKYNIEDLKEASLYYPDYIVSEVKKENYIYVSEGAFLIPDYFKYDDTKKTHASINHQLGTANVLLQTYAKTNNRNYYNAGMSILRGLEGINDKWLREDGDLWYRMNPDFTFEGTDYKTLTLNDLLVVQETLELIGENKCK